MTRANRKGASTRSSLPTLGSPTVIDLFCGAGGVTTGFKSQGFLVLAAVDTDSIARRSYHSNHPDVLLLDTDLLVLDPQELLQKTKLRPGQLDVLTACAPCQPFSSLAFGRAKRGDSRSKLVGRIGDFAAILKPRAIVLENVPPLVGKLAYKRLCKRLSTQGYQVEQQLINSADFGVPQKRKRLVAVAMKLADDACVPRIVPDHPALRRWRLRQTVRDALSQLKPSQKVDPLRIVVRSTSVVVRQRIAAIPKDGGSRSSLPARLQLKCHRNLMARNQNGAGNVYGRMKWDDVAPTLTTRCASPACGRFIHPSLNRAITLREAAMIQTFPLRYIFVGGRTSIQAQIGNAVPPRLAAAIAAIVRYEIGPR